MSENVIPLETGAGNTCFWSIMQSNGHLSNTGPRAKWIGCLVPEIMDKVTKINIFKNHWLIPLTSNWYLFPIIIKSGDPRSFMIDSLYSLRMKTCVKSPKSSFYLSQKESYKWIYVISRSPGSGRWQLMIFFSIRIKS